MLSEEGQHGFHDLVQSEQGTIFHAITGLYFSMNRASRQNEAIAFRIYALLIENLRGNVHKPC